MLKINQLVSGGIITNYNCSSKCRHCVYASSPSWPKDYMTPSDADEILTMLKRLDAMLYILVVVNRFAA